MKRRILLVTLIALLVIPLVFTGCATTKKADTATTPTIEQRVAALEGASVNYALQSQLNAYASLDDLQALSDSVDEALADVDTPDLSGYVTDAELANVINNLTADQIALLKTKLGLSSSGNGSSGSTSGEVTVVLDMDEVPFLFTSTTGSQVLPVKIINGTSKYQEVKFNLTLQCVSEDGEASVSALTVAVNTVGMTITYVPTDMTHTQLIYATWVGSKVLVAPNKETTVYIYITGFTTVSSEVWQATLSGILATEL